MLFLLQAASWSDWLIELSRQIQTAVLGSIDRLVTGTFSRLPFLLAGFIVLLLFWLASKLARLVFLTATRRTNLDARLRTLLSRMIVVFVVTIGVFSSLTVVIPSFDFGSLIAGLGFTSFVVGFATKDILNNFLSGILILWQQPFHIGDYLFIGKDQGKVEYIGVRATSLRTDDGELILIPNGDMYSSALTIRGAGEKRRMTIKFNLGYDEDIDRAKSITYDALVSAEGVVTDPKPNVYVTDLASQGVLITINFWLNTYENRPLVVYDHAAISIMRALDEAEFKLFPPGSMIVQSPKETPAEEEPAKKRSFDL
ncbi:MAG: mechanosensitive ion channel family protein [Acidobacteriota bacterium]